MTTAAALQGLRRYLVLVLMAALALSAWIPAGVADFEESAFGPGPWPAEQTVDASAIIEPLVELDAEDSANASPATALAGRNASDVSIAAAQRPQPPDLFFRADNATDFPNKTGPPSA